MTNKYVKLFFAVVWTSAVYNSAHCKADAKTMWEGPLGNSAELNNTNTSTLRKKDAFLRSTDVPSKNDNVNLFDKKENNIASNDNTTSDQHENKNKTLLKLIKDNETLTSENSKKNTDIDKLKTDIDRLEKEKVKVEEERKRMRHIAESRITRLEFFGYCMILVVVEALFIWFCRFERI